MLQRSDHCVHGRRRFEHDAEAEGARALDLTSGAGHDAMVVGRHVPAGMLFVPSRDGLSHNPGEYTSPEQCELGARVLARASTRLAVFPHTASSRTSMTH